MSILDRWWEDATGVTQSEPEDDGLLPTVKNALGYLQEAAAPPPAAQASAGVPPAPADAASDMYRMGLEQPSDEPAPPLSPTTATDDLPPWERPSGTLPNGRGSVAPRFPVDVQQPGEQPYDVTDREGIDQTTINRRAPDSGLPPPPEPGPPYVTNPYALPDDAMYRQPLGSSTPVRDRWATDNPPAPATNQGAVSTYNDPTAGGTISQPLPAPAPRAQVVPNEDATSYPRPSYVPPAQPLVEAPAPTANDIWTQGAGILPAGRKPTPIEIPPLEPYGGYRPEEVPPDEAARRASVAGLAPGEHLTTPPRPAQAADEEANPTPTIGSQVRALPAQTLEHIQQAFGTIEDDLRASGQAYREGDLWSALWHGGAAALNTGGLPYTLGAEVVDDLLPDMRVAGVGPGTLAMTAQMVHDLGRIAASGVRVTRKVIDAVRNGTAADQIIAIANRAASSIDRGIEGLQAGAERARALEAERAGQPGVSTFGTFGFSPREPTPPDPWQAARSRLDAVAPRLDAAEQAVRDAERTGDTAAIREADRAYGAVRAEYDAAVDDLSAAQRSRQAQSAQIEQAGYGRPMEEADTLPTELDANAPGRYREAALPRTVDDTTRAGSVSLNATLGASPPAPRRTGATRNPVGAYEDRYVSSGARDVVDAYEAATPARIQEAERRTIQIATDLVAGERADPATRRRVSGLLTQTVDAGERMLDDSKVLATGLDGRALDALSSGEGFTNKFSGIKNLDDAIDATWERVGKARITREQAREFTQRELRADQMVLGEHNLNGRMYAHVTAGPPLIAEAKPAAWFIWENDTPRVTSIHHHYGLGSPHADIHADTPPGIKRALWGTDAVAGARRIETAPGGPLNVGWRGAGLQAGDRVLADTPWAVGPSGESRMRMLTQILATPTSKRNSIGQMIRRGEISDPETLAATLLRESSAQQQPAVEAAKAALGIPGGEAGGEAGRAVGKQFRLGSATNYSRTESLILDPNPANIRAIYLVGDGDRYLNETLERTGGLVKGTTTRLEAAQQAQARLREMTGRDVPIIFKDTSVALDEAGQTAMASGSKLIDDAVEILSDGSRRPISAEEALAPGRSAIRDRYMDAGFSDIGATAGYAPGAPSASGPGFMARGGALDVASRQIGSAVGTGGFGALTGYSAPADTEEERLRNATTGLVVGAGLGLGLHNLSRLSRAGAGAHITPGFSPGREPHLPGLEPGPLERTPSTYVENAIKGPEAGTAAERRRGTSLPGLEPGPLDRSPDTPALPGTVDVGPMTDAERAARAPLPGLEQSPNVWRRIQDAIEPWSRRLGIVRYGGMLSDTASQAFNIFSNVLIAGKDIAQTPITATLDVGRSALTGKPREAFFSEVPARVAGMRAGAKAGLEVAGEIMRTGLRPEDAAKLDQEIRGFGTNIPGLAPAGSRRAGAIDAAFEYPLRALSAADAVFRGMAEGGHTAAEGLAAAMKAHPGEKITPAMISEALKDPSVLERVKELSARSVLQEDRTVTNWYRQALNYKGKTAIEQAAVPVLQAGVRLEIPFVKTPYNVVAQGMGMTPAGLVGLVQDVAEGRGARQMEQRLAGVALGTALMAGAAVDYANGNLTGPYPTDAAERSTLPPGWQPWSRKFTFPDGSTRYVSLALLGPFAVPPVLAILGAEAAKQGKDALSLEWAGQVAAGLGQYAAQQTFFQGAVNIGKIFDTQAGGNAAERNVEQVVAQFSPHVIGGGGLGREIQRVMGEPLRDPHGAMEALLATFPYTADQVAPRQDVLGRPRIQGGGIVSTVLRSSQENDAAVIRAYRKAGEGLPLAAPKTVTDPSTQSQRTLTPRQQQRWRRVFGAELRDGWDNKGNPTDQRTLREIESKARQTATETVLGLR